MKVLVATSDGQGDHNDDFFFTIEGELVSMPFGPCPDDLCECTPPPFGLSTSKGSTTVTAVDMPDLDEAGYITTFHDAMERMGWLPAFDPGELEDWARWHLDLAAALPVDTVARTHISDAGAITLYSCQCRAQPT